MSNYISNNAYRTLGLDTTATTSDIAKRLREIIARSKIDDLPTYDLDINEVQLRKNELEVKKAAERLALPRKKIFEYFFWFEIRDNLDEQAVGLLKSNNIEDAIRVWDDKAIGNTIKSYGYRKNLAILLISFLEANINKLYLDRVLILWKEIIESEKFWSSFKKVYDLHDDLGVENTLYKELQEQATKLLADIFSDLAKKHNDPSIILHFNELFDTHGSNVEKEYINPTVNILSEHVSKLESLNVSEDGIFDDEEKKEIQQSIEVIQGELNKLIDIGLYDDTKVKSLRDRVANALRLIVLDLHNNLSETDISISLINVAEEIAGTDSLTNKLKQDKKTLKDVEKDAKELKPLLDLFEEKKYQEAMQKADEYLATEQNKKPKNVKRIQQLQEQKKMALILYIMKMYEETVEQWSINKESALPMFDEMYQLIYDNFDLFELDKEAIDKVLNSVVQTIKDANIDNLSQLDEMRRDMLTAIQDKLGDTYERNIVTVLFDCVLYSGLTHKLSNISKKMNVYNILYVLGWITVWFYGVGFIFWIAAWVYKSRIVNKA